jgi:hypothetical protein
MHLLNLKLTNEDKRRGNHGLLFMNVSYERNEGDRKCQLKLKYMQAKSKRDICKPSQSAFYEMSKRDSVAFL